MKLSLLFPALLAQLGIEEQLEQLDLGTTLTETTLVGWITLLVGIFGGLAVGRIAQAILRRIGNRMISRGWDSRGTVFLDAAAPLNLALFTAGLRAGLQGLHMSEQVYLFVYGDELRWGVLGLLYTIAFGWFLYNLANLIDVGLASRITATKSALDRQVVPLIRKTLRIFLVAVFVLFIAENFFGANIGAWLAGLGIAGLAVSLAAQESIKNLFGSITIFLDKPYRVGDRIVFGGHDGFVEDIGFRSTKMRTLIGHVVTIPNSRIVDSEVENIARRANLRRLLNVTITYDTPPEKIEQAVQIIRDILTEPEFASAFEDMENFPPRVYFNDFNDASLNIIVLYWFYPVDWWAFQEFNQRFNLRLVRAYEEAGIEFAFPTQTLYLARDEKRQLAVQMLDRNGGVP